MGKSPITLCDCERFWNDLKFPSAAGLPGGLDSPGITESECSRNYPHDLSAFTGVTAGFHIKGFTMKVDNVFNLLNKFDKEEDRISADFGFLLSNNKKLLKHFCGKINIALSRKELGEVDIETQVAYDSGKSRIDMQLTIYGRFLVFLESKIVKNENAIIKQLNKYAGILNSLRDQYDDRVRLIYVNKFPIDDNKKENILSQIRLDRDKLYLFSWEDLLKMSQQHRKGEIYKQFKTYIGDRMFSKRVMKEQRIKDVVEALVIHTNEENWKLIQKKK